MFCFLILFFFEGVVAVAEEASGLDFSFSGGSDEGGAVISPNPYSFTRVLASLGLSLKRLLRSRGNKGEGVGGSRLTVDPASAEVIPPEATVDIGVGVGPSGTTGVGGTRALLDTCTGDWAEAGRGRSRGRSGAVRDVERRVAL